MNLRFVEAFHWASSLKSVTRAAEKLHLSQSALSDRISSLENELGVVLLDRREKQFRLTVAGQRFQSLAIKLLELQRQVKQELGSRRTGPVTLRIGAIESVVHSWLPGWLQGIRKHHPDFELELTVETSPVLVEQVDRGVLDLAFTAMRGSDSEVRTIQMPSMPMVFVGHQTLHAKSKYSLSDLCEFDLITFQRGSQPHQALLQLFQENGVPVPRIHAISSISAIVQLVEGGLGIATLPRAATQHLSRRLPLRIVRAEVPLSPLPIHANFREHPGSDFIESMVNTALIYVDQLASKGKRKPRAVLA